MSICNRAHPRHCERSEAIQLSMRRCGLLRCARNDGAIVIRNQSARISARVMPAAFSPIIGALELPPISIGLIAALTCATPRRLVFSASNRLRPIGSSTPVLADPTGQRGGGSGRRPRFAGRTAALWGPKLRFCGVCGKSSSRRWFCPSNLGFCCHKIRKRRAFPLSKAGRR